MHFRIIKQATKDYPMRKLILAALAAMAFAAPAHASYNRSLPSEFVGQWCSVKDGAYYERGKCSDQAEDGTITITPNGYTAWEYGCEFTKVDQIGRGRYSVHGFCGGEGVTSVTRYTFSHEGWRIVLDSNPSSNELGDSEGPSFNCHYAKQPDEVAICQDFTLQSMDRQVASLYANGMRITRGGIKATQVMWLRARQSCRYDANCIKAVYKDRLAELDHYAERATHE
jgi:hypothetical protein